MDKGQKIIKERSEVYGEFHEIARTNKFAMDAIRQSSQWSQLVSKEQIAIEMCIHKIARIVNSPYAKGRFNAESDMQEAYKAWLDSWLDASNYLKLGCPEAFRDE